MHFSHQFPYPRRRKPAADHGHTEEIIGRWLAQGSGRCEGVALAVKVYNLMNRQDGRREPNRDTRVLSALTIARHCANSLERKRAGIIKGP